MECCIRGNSSFNPRDADIAHRKGARSMQWVVRHSMSSGIAGSARGRSRAVSCSWADILLEQGPNIPSRSLTKVISLWRSSLAKVPRTVVHLAVSGTFSGVEVSRTSPSGDVGTLARPAAKASIPFACKRHQHQVDCARHCWPTSSTRDADHQYEHVGLSGARWLRAISIPVPGAERLLRRAEVEIKIARSPRLLTTEKTKSSIW